MKRVALSEVWVRGAVSLEYREDGVKPWRIPYRDHALFPPDGIGSKAEICSGIRLCLATDSSVIRLEFVPVPGEARIDCVIGGKLTASTALEAGNTEVCFELGGGTKDVVLYLPQNIGMTLTGLWIEPGTDASPLQDEPVKWVAYGSSITQCAGAFGPSRTWPAIAARKGGLDLTCLGFSGNCHLEPMVARMIRDLPADFISLGVGINVYGAASLSPRTFQPALIGMIATIREKHERTPLLVISPLYGAHRETTSNQLGLDLPMMRDIVRQTIELFQSRGDRHIYYMNGLELLSEADAARLPDDLHPDGEGYVLLGSRFAERVLQPFREKGILGPFFC